MSVLSVLSPAPKAAPRISFVSLGCPKALVDSERIITQLRAEGYDLAKTHAGADLVIVNTCGFLDSAKQESLAAIGEAMDANGKVIVTGCMGAEPQESIAEQISQPPRHHRAAGLRERRSAAVRHAAASRRRMTRKSRSGAGAGDQAHTRAITLI